MSTAYPKTTEEVRLHREQLLKRLGRAKAKYQRDYLLAQIGALDWVLGEDGWPYE